MNRIVFAVVLPSALCLLPGCKRKEARDRADSDAVCKGFQQCLRTDTSTEVSRMGEQDANKIGKGNKH
jgi:hypothetical protein